MVQIKYTKIFYNNQWHDSLSGRTFATLNPATEEKLADVQEGYKADVDKAVEAAVAAFETGSEWRKMDASARAKMLHKLADLIEREIDFLAELEVADNGKPLKDAKVDILFSNEVLRYCAGWADKIHGKTIPADGNVFSYTKIDPVGVCGQVIPWNYPLMMFIWKIAPALATGNTVIVKPAEQTPLTALHLCSLIVEAGFPPGVVNVVPGFGPTAGAALVSHPDVNKVAFTGSTSVGRIVGKLAIDGVKRVTLELGGKSPLVITPNFDLKKAAEIANSSVFANMGQCCCAASRTFVHESIYDDFVAETGRIAEARKFGDPMNAATEFGPQISETQVKRIMELVESGKTEGARVVTGGKRAAGKGYFIEPTVFADVKDEMRIAREEIFGPVQQILKYSSLDEVIKRCNDTTYGLAAGILSNDVNEVLKFTTEVRAGSIWVNKYLHVAPQTPFGGFKMSGLSRENGEEGLRNYCEIKTVTISMD